MIIHIVAMGINKEIGCENKLLWTHPLDMKRFKEKTQNQSVVMGRKTFDSIKSYMKGDEFLPNRECFVLSSSFIDHAFHNVTQAYLPKDNFIVIGGASVYAQFEPDIIFMTHIHQEFKNADTFYPIDLSKYTAVNIQKHDGLCFATYIKEGV